MKKATSEKLKKDAGAKKSKEKAGQCKKKASKRKIPKNSGFLQEIFGIIFVLLQFILRKSARKRQ